MNRIEEIKANVMTMKRSEGRADYLRHLSKKTLTRQQAIRAKCWECVQGEDTEPCIVLTCPLLQYSQWNQ